MDPIQPGEQLAGTVGPSFHRQIGIYQQVLARFRTGHRHQKLQAGGARQGTQIILLLVAQQGGDAAVGVQFPQFRHGVRGDAPQQQGGGEMQRLAPSGREVVGAALRRRLRGEIAVRQGGEQRRPGCVRFVSHHSHQFPAPHRFNPAGDLGPAQFPRRHAVYERQPEQERKHRIGRGVFHHQGEFVQSSVECRLLTPNCPPMRRQFRRRVQHQFRHRVWVRRAAKAPGQALVIQADAGVFDWLCGSTPKADTDEDLVRFCSATEGIGLDSPTGDSHTHLFLSKPCVQGAEKIVQDHGGSNSAGK